jgi:mono/diheme cytochrome c family protein
MFTFAACGAKRPKRLSVQTSARVEAAFYRSQCVICHGAEAEGKDIGGRITPSMRDGDILTKSDEYIYDQIYNGGNGMPPFKHQMTEQQIKNMVQFIRDLQKETP